MNLNLGSGTNRIQDYISVDLYTPEADLGLDLAKPLPFPEESIDNIYASHFIEHLSRKEWMTVYPSWVYVLKPGGTITLRCPDIIKSCQQLIDNPYDEWSYQVLYGLQSNEGEYHKNGFTEQQLRNCFPALKAEVLVPSTDYELHMRFTK